MAATFLLIRHAEHELLGRVLTGRLPGVTLSETGWRQAERLARHLAQAGLTALQSSPAERTMQTAAPIAAASGLRCVPTEALDEIDFGAWTGKSFEDLAADPRWRAWNDERGRARAPGGEFMGRVQARILGHLEDMAAAEPDGRIAMVSHGDVIKAAVLGLIGAPLDAIATIEIEPAGITTLVVGDWGGKVLGLNARALP